MYINKGLSIIIIIYAYYDFHRERELEGWKMMTNILTFFPKVKSFIIVPSKNDDNYDKNREGGGQKIMIEITRSENDDNDRRPIYYVYFY